MLISPLIDPFAIHNIVEDTSPQLGGDLDVNNKEIKLANNNLLGWWSGGQRRSYVQGKDSCFDLAFFASDSIHFYAGGDAGHFILFKTVDSLPEITTSGGCNLKITASGGTIDFNDENLITTGDFQAGRTGVGGYQCTFLGNALFGAVGSAYGASAYFIAGENQSVQFFLYADEGDDNADKWRFKSASTNDFTISNKVSGSFVDKLKITTAGAVYLPGVYGDSHGGTGRAMYIQSNGQLTCDTSARRFKENIKDLSDTSWIYDLTPREADWKNSNIKADPVLIAEEVELVNPKLISHAPEYRYESHKKVGPDGEDETEDELVEVTEMNVPEGVQYYKLIVPMLKEIQKLRQEIDALGATQDGPK